MNHKEGEKDYKIVDRNHNSVKYFLAQMRQPGIDTSKALYVSHADMEFKFPSQLLKKVF